MTIHREHQEFLIRNPKTWLITGVAGFIGSNLLEALLNLGQTVKGVDNFLTGKRDNLESVKQSVGETAWQRFEFVQGDITDANLCHNLCQDVDYVLHQAAVVSVPRSFREPTLSVKTNVIGFLNVLTAARETGVERFVFASSSSVYGDHLALPKIEGVIGKPLSPYALGKYTNEVLATLLCTDGRMQTVGLRYFNVFGPRQNADGEYAAVIPKFIKALMKCEPPIIYGDGETTRDFCYVDNVLQANLLAALTNNLQSTTSVFNIAVGEQTSLNRLYRLLQMIIAHHTKNERVREIKPLYEPFRPGDIRHSLADITFANKILGYVPGLTVRSGLERMVVWMLGQNSSED